MTTTTNLDPAHAAGTGAAVAGVDSLPVSQRRAVASEWIKFRTLRSSWAVLGLALLGMLAIGLLVAYNTRHLTPNLDANDVDQSATLQGYYLGQLLVGALGVLYVTGEYGTGTIRSTLAAVPTRLPVLWAKFVVYTAVVATTVIPTCVVAYLAAQGLLSHYRSGYSLGDPGVIRVVIGTGLYLTVLGALGVAVGWVVRNTAGGIVAYLALVLVLPVIFGNVLGTWGKDVGKYLPSTAGAAVANTIPDGPSLSPWVGFAVLCAWVLAATATATVVLRRRDA